MQIQNAIPEKKVILIADYGRSGQGWLSYMLCYVLNAKYVEPYYFLSGALYTEDKALRNITSGDLPGREKTAYSMVIKTHELPATNFHLTDKVIFLMRDPRDVAVSAYFMYRVIIEEDTNRSLKNKIFYLIHRSKLTSFMHTALKWRKFFRTWTARKDISLYAVRYEDLLTDTEKTLKGILFYLEVSVPDSLLQEAIQKFSFENLSGRKRGEEDNANPTFRKGIIGDYKNHFSRIDRMLFERICGKEMETLGYIF